ncbi:MAG: TIGR03435 family protein, partial [Bryobacteraceae bacterium]
MRKLMLWMIGLAALLGSALQAQDIRGQWQGTLEPAKGIKRRIVFKISLENDKLQASFYTVDQPSPPIGGSITRNGSTLRMTIPALNGKYEGKLGAGGNSITGTLTLGAPMPLNLTRATPETAWAIPEPPPPPRRMVASVDPAFEVATIKPSDPDGLQGMVISWQGTQYVTKNTPLHALIILGYWVHSKQLIGEPAWSASDKFDLTGKPDAPGEPSVDQMRSMLRKLLADRFQLKFHHETKEMPVYAITIVKAGTKLTKSQADPNSLPATVFGASREGTTFMVRNATLATAAAVLQTRLDKPIVDQTGLSDKYDFTLTFTQDVAQA